MRKLWVLCLGLAVNAAGANPTYCYSMKDADARNLCLAQNRSQKSYCYSIRESDARNYCLATVGGGKSYCYSIRNSDERNFCLSKF